MIDIKSSYKNQLQLKNKFFDYTDSNDYFRVAWF